MTTKEIEVQRRITNLQALSQSRVITAQERDDIQWFLDEVERLKTDLLGQRGAYEMCAYESGEKNAKINRLLDEVARLEHTLSEHAKLYEHIRLQWHQDREENARLRAVAEALQQNGQSCSPKHRSSAEGAPDCECGWCVWVRRLYADNSPEALAALDREEI